MNPDRRKMVGVFLCSKTKRNENPMTEEIKRFLKMQKIVGISIVALVFLIFIVQLIYSYLK